MHDHQRRRDPTALFWKFQLQIDILHSLHRVVARKARNSLSQVCLAFLEKILKLLRLLEIERMTGMEFLGEEDRVRRVALRSTMNVEGDLDWAFKEPSSSSIASFEIFLFILSLLNL